MSLNCLSGFESTHTHARNHIIRTATKFVWQQPECNQSDIKQVFRLHGYSIPRYGSYGNSVLNCVRANGSEISKE